MLGQQFYHETVRNVIVAFGTMFNNINIVRKDNSGVITQSMKVPLAYGPKQKWLTRLDQDPSLGSAVAITLPRLGFEIGSLSYDPTRKLNRVQKFKKVKIINQSNRGPAVATQHGIDISSGDFLKGLLITTTSSIVAFAVWANAVLVASAKIEALASAICEGKDISILQKSRYFFLLRQEKQVARVFVRVSWCTSVRVID